MVCPILEQSCLAPTERDPSTSCRAPEYVGPPENVIGNLGMNCWDQNVVLDLYCEPWAGDAKTSRSVTFNDAGEETSRSCDLYQ